LIVKNPAKKIWKGFPFDSVFYLPQKKNVFVKLTPKEKAEFSHRFQALKKALPILKKFFNAGGQKKAKIINHRASIYGSESKNIRSSLPFAVTRVGREEDEVLFAPQ